MLCQLRLYIWINKIFVKLSINIYKTLISVPSRRREGGMAKNKTMVKYNKKWQKRGATLSLLNVLVFDDILTGVGPFLQAVMKN